MAASKIVKKYQVELLAKLMAHNSALDRKLSEILDSFKK